MSSRDPTTEPFEDDDEPAVLDCGPVQVQALKDPSGLDAVEAVACGGVHVELSCGSGAPEDHPPWILEMQQLNLGSWEPIGSDALSRFHGWLMGEEEQPFIAALERGQRTPGSFPLSADLRMLVYPEVESTEKPCAAAAYSPWVDSTTDPDGWIYSTSKERLTVPRVGGRASRRISDRFRQRWWACGAVEMPVPKRRSLQEVDEESSNRIYSSLQAAVAEILSTRSLSELPMDPTAALRRAKKEKDAFADMCQRLPPWSDCEVLGQLLVAALYSRAAYGLTARLGMFDSVVSGAAVFSFGRAAFDLAEDVDDDSNKAAFLDMLGLAAQDIVQAQWRSEGPFRPAYAIVRDHTMKWIVVTIRGTLSTKDILTDVAARCVPFFQGLAHEGFVHASQNLVQEIEPTLEREVAAWPDYRLVLCGHSMGGAIAAMGTILLREKAAWASTCTAMGIGTPAVLSRAAGEWLQERMAAFTVVNARDWSPRASLTSVNELLDDLHHLSVASTFMRAATNSPVAEPREDDPEVEQLPPGQILQIVPSEEDEPARLLAAEPTDYRHSMPVWPDVEAHIPLAYIQGLLSGFRAGISTGRPKRRGSSQSSLLGIEMCWTRTSSRAAREEQGGAALLPSRPHAPLRPAPVLAVLRRLLLAELEEQPQVAGQPKHPDRVRELITEFFSDVL